MQLNALRAELINRGFHVDGLSDLKDTVLVTIDVLEPGVAPRWRKAVVLPVLAATPDGFELAFDAWKFSVLGAIAEGFPSPIIRHMLEAHGSKVVMDAMKPRFARAA